MAGKGSSDKGKGMPGPPSRGTLLFRELLEISGENYEEQMLAAVSLFLKKFFFLFENYQLDNLYFAFRWIGLISEFKFVLLGYPHTIFSFQGFPQVYTPLQAAHTLS